MASEELHSDYTIRKIESKDYEDVVQTLGVLTTVGNLSREQFSEVVAKLDAHPDIYNTFVVVNKAKNNKVVAVGSVFVEQKIIHEGGKVGHIEDIAVSTEEQGRKLGLHLIRKLTEVGRSNGCYKIILDCDEKNVGFYEKCGYKREGVEMGIRF